MYISLTKRVLVLVTLYLTKSAIISQFSFYLCNLKVIHIHHDLRKMFITLVWNDQ